MRILAIKLREIGDTVLLTASLAALRKKYPEATLDVLTLQKNLAVLENLESIDSVFCIRKRSGLQLLLRLVQLRAQSYDLALGFHVSSSLEMFIRWAGAKENILHHHGRLETPARSDRKLENPGQLKNALLRDYEVLKTIGISHKPLPTRIAISEAEKIWARNKLGALGLDVDAEILALLPGASSPTKRLKIESWTTIIQDIRIRRKPAVVLVDRPLSLDWNLRSLCKKNGIQLVDDVSLRQLICLISLCNKAIAMDSAPLHIAVALGLPTYSFFGPSCVGDWHPYNKQEHHVFRLPVDCRSEGPRQQDAFQYCSVAECGHHSCMKHNPQTILQKAMQ